MLNQAQKVSGDRCLTERRSDDPLFSAGSSSTHSGAYPRATGRKSAYVSVARRASRTSGFTVIELVVAMAVAAVLASIALPAFNGFIVQQRLTASANSFAGAIAYARSESTRRGATVSLQAQVPDGENEWGRGYCIVVGNPGNCVDALRLYDPANQATLNGQGALNAVGTLSFNGRGLFTLGATGQIDLCSDDTLEDPGRRLEISVIGRLNVSELDCPD